MSLNWNNFKAKYHEKEQKCFEQLCYLLFCKEFNINIGIFRYKNQTGIETEPIKVDDNLIGFQAKFYETKISENKDDIIKSIAKAKSKNKKLNKILFYVNKEFSESSKKDKKEPAYKTEIEKYAKSQSIEIEWRVPSHFEAQLALDKNRTLAQHFFGLEKSVIDFVGELTQHTESILTPIHSKIEFENEEIKIDRSKAIKKLKAISNESSLIILSGEGGVGKTAVIKDFYNLIKEKTPFFVFKATEFNIPNINQIFTNYGHFTLLDFIKEHQGSKEKYIVIDSAEKLSDLESRDAFQEFISAILGSNWNIIFTTRHSYLDDLKFQFIEIYRVGFQSLNIEKLSIEEIAGLAEKYKFKLPDNERLLDILRIPFYLNEYLLVYEGLQDAISYSDFKKILWDKKISKTTYHKSIREDYFLKIAYKRAKDGHLFVKAEDSDVSTLNELETDEIIKYDSNVDGYFITHDIYEEWALDKIIDRSFNNLKSNQEFFLDIGSSLPIRRAFRIWLSEKLFNDIAEAKLLIESTVIDDAIESYWKDEIYTSVLLSDYVSVFFELFENKLLEDNQKLLMRIIFLLRIACKEVDEKMLNLLGMKNKAGVAFKTIFTKPKGSGWDYVIDFIHKHKKDFGLQNINVILPLLTDWNSKHSSGETTQKASQIALFHYEEITKNADFRYHVSNATKEQLTKVILQGASEITDELKVIFNEIIAGNQTGHTDKYYHIVKTILTSMADGIHVVRCLPKHVIKLADLFWFRSSIKSTRYGGHSFGVEESFGLSTRHELNYYPPSSLQTPIFHLLQVAPKETVDFILSFTNKCVECYMKSRFNNEIEEVEVCVNDTTTIRQYISNRLWNMYRGTQVSTHLLESMHMALEKWLLTNAESMSKKNLQSWCLYLIKNSVSASITAVVTSVVIANYSKLFDVAKVLFQTKEFFTYDTSRMMLDMQHKSSLEIFKFPSLGDYQKELYENERIKSCDEPHRKLALEHIALNYQAFKIEDVSEEEVKERQEAIWAILDKYYQKLSAISNETENDKTWRLYLARMDWRKMKPTLEEKDGQTLIMLNPELAPELKEFSEESIKESSESMKYLSLRYWAEYKFKREEDNYKKYEQYENNYEKVLSETKEIVDSLEKNSDESYYLFNHSIPAYTCSVLIRDFIKKLNIDEKKFCKEVIIKYATIPFTAEHYNYQISDGTEPSIVTLSNLIKYFPKEREDIILILLLSLINPWREVSTFAIRSILYGLWEIDYDAAHTIFLGYLYLKPKYEDLNNDIRKEKYQNKIYEFSEKQVRDSFVKKYEGELENVVSNKITYAELDNLEKLDLKALQTAFELIPLKTENEDHKKFLAFVFPVFSKKLLKEDDRDDYTVKNRILDKFACIILNSTKEEIETYLKPFVDNFTNSRSMAEFFEEFISVEDRLNQYDEFWIVWNAFYKNIVDVCIKESRYHYTKEILRNYLLAWPYWKEDAKEWHTLKEREKSFYRKVAEDIGHHPSVFYSISKILNDIGSNFIDDGIIWISNILLKNKELISGELETNTIYYTENIIRRYVLTNRKKIKTSLQIKNQVIVILNFLVERGSVTGYLLREDIL